MRRHAGGLGAEPPVQALVIQMAAQRCGLARAFSAEVSCEDCLRTPRHQGFLAVRQLVAICRGSIFRPIRRTLGSLLMHGQFHNGVSALFEFARTCGGAL